MFCLRVTRLALNSKQFLLASQHLRNPVTKILHSHCDSERKNRFQGILWNRDSRFSLSSGLQRHSTNEAGLSLVEPKASLMGDPSRSLHAFGGILRRFVIVCSWDGTSSVTRCRRNAPLSRNREECHEINCFLSLALRNAMPVSIVCNFSHVRNTLRLSVRQWQEFFTPRRYWVDDQKRRLLFWRSAVCFFQASSLRK